MPDFPAPLPDTMIDPSGGGQDPHALNIAPRIQPPSRDQIPLGIRIGCTSRIRLQETFQRTITYTAPFIYETDCLNYTNLIPAVANFVWNYVNSEKQSGAVVQTHVGIWLDNVTHPSVASGVVRLAKGHRDSQLSNEEFTSVQVLVDHLQGNITDVINAAKY